jgi:hypothetical protein
MIKVKEVIVHPSYGVETVNSADIALLELEVSAQPSPSVQLACLPTQADVKSTFQDKKFIIRYIWLS